ncbi:hypothetical protein [Methylobacterium durans]|uniref:Uncharacterized protein n=1 Tax=Methylobacterium durans TaxID=2202825 RepID=A0A2U8WC99_9HYPH|nr:hypothetical protein [Methylobacterium durans]AWN43785.1 hypothetical protein DK389_28800 [Methylobacterium durans]
MPAHEQLLAALRVILTEGQDPRAVIAHAIEDVERETAKRQAPQEAPGPYTPNAWSMYAGRVH